MAPLPDREPRRWRPPAAPGDDPDRVLPALADLQRHLDALGDDLAAADRALTGWEGRARDRFRHHVVVDLARLAELLDDLRHVRNGLDDPAGRLVDPATPWRPS